MDVDREFDSFVDAAWPALLKTACMMTGDWHSAEDLVQTALLKSWRRWASIRDPTAANAYVRRTMVRTYLSWRTRLWIGESPAALTEQIAQDEFRFTDDREVVMAALGALSPKQRAAITLRFYADLSERETARLMGCSIASVKKHTARAIAALRNDPHLDYLAQNGVGNG